MVPQLLLAADRFRVERVHPNGRPPRDVIRHPGAAAMIPLVDTDHVCLVQNGRVAVGRTLLELPAGTRDPGESPHETAVRELAEETGYAAGDLQLIAEFFVSPGILDEQMSLFLAQDLTPVGARRQPDEQIENVILGWDEAMRMVDRGEIQDAKTLVGLCLYDRLRRR